MKRDSLAIDNLREYIEKDSSIFSINPKVSSEWNYEKNGDLKPEYFAANSGKIVWWKCSKGHEWQTTIQSRNNGSGCPYCSGRIAVTGKNDLQTVNPILAKEWNYEKNNILTPQDVLPNSDKKVWWKCSNGHEWQATIGNRNKGRGCPYCSGRIAVVGKNDLQTLSPTLSEEWNYEKNKGLTPQDVLPNSNKKVWWRCSKGHEWQAAICDRNIGNRCPYCTGSKVLKGFNDLATLVPDLVSEWNYEKNYPLKPDEVKMGSNKKVWWKCHICNHEWQTTICNRTGKQKTGCPKCSRRKTKHKKVNEL